MKQAVAKAAKGWAVWKLIKRVAPSRRKSKVERAKKPALIGAFGLGAAAAAVLAKVGGRRAAARAKGAAHSAASAVTPDRDYDDVTLARKVETELFRPADVPKGDISVSVADGVVELRGQIEDPKQVEALGKQAKGVEGVKDVRNLLHTA